MKVLGLDIGTNSIGWGIVNETEHKIEKCGVYLFPEGVKKENVKESSKAAERTSYRSARRLKFRRKLRKYETLKVLINNNMCPLTLEELELWRNEKKYPTSKDFIKWYRTDEVNNWEPYFLRKKSVEMKASKFEIGRAMYHIAQRRGFLSNRKESTKVIDGNVSKSITDLNILKGDKTLGQYFYELKQSGEKVRGHYTSRKEHYEEEFFKICEVQNLDEDLKNSLYKAIFFQRKLKSQKFLVGKCTFEPKKTRCPVSHFDFEEFRMLSFINSIKVAKCCSEEDVQKFDFLTDEEKKLISPLFFRVSKPSFYFIDIAKKLCGKQNEYWKFNYRNDTTVSGCPVSCGLRNVFGETWKETQIDNYDIYDIWHVLFDFDDDEKLHQFAVNKLHLEGDTIKKFCDIHMQQGYANLSLKAIHKILPFLRKGYLYSHAVFMANVPAMIGKEVFEKDADKIEKAILDIISTVPEKNKVLSITNFCLDKIFRSKDFDFHTEEWDKSIVDELIYDVYGKRNFQALEEKKQIELKNEVVSKIEDCLKISVTNNPNDYKYQMYRMDDLIKEFLRQSYSVNEKKSLYHPSDGDNPSGKELTYLGSPRTPSIKNPVAMRALFQLRKLINYLIKTGLIDSQTKINIELATGVNDKNWRKAIYDFQKENEKKNNEYKNNIIALCKEKGISIEPTEADIKKYRLWKEQGEICFYTGKPIKDITDLFGNTPQFDFEHTIPRSLSYDDSLENLTLCESSFNRTIKKQKIPYELANYEEVFARVNKAYEDKIESCFKIIAANSTKGRYFDPAVKDAMIVKRHKAQLELDYYRGKLKRFYMSHVPEGFKNSQLNDTRIITKYSLSYLKSVFNYVQPVNGAMTDLFKRQWGLLGREETKNRSDYRHHIIDAITIACINRGKFNLLCESIKNSSDGTHIKFAKPWESFDRDVLDAVQYIVPKNFVDDNSLRQTKRILRDRYGKPIIKNGKPVYLAGATARGSLHRDTFYGCIMTPPEKGVKSEQIYVVRKSTADLKKENASKIIDKRIAQIFVQNIENNIQTIEDIQTKGILLPEKKDGKDIYAKKIRIKAKCTKPLVLKQHHNVSDRELKDYKQNYYVENGENYLFALYRGKDSKGKLVSVLEVSNLMNSVKKRLSGDSIVPETINKQNIELNLYKVIKNGQMVILQENEEDDVRKLPKAELYKKIYRVSSIASEGQVKFVHCLVNMKELEKEKKNTANKSVLFDEKIEKIKRIRNYNIYCLVEGVDFVITPAGDIEFKQ